MHITKAFKYEACYTSFFIPYLFQKSTTRFVRSTRRSHKFNSIRFTLLLYGDGKENEFYHFSSKYVKKQIKKKI
jgi:hypothetical protein